jgi:hypothetical protein
LWSYCCCAQAITAAIDSASTGTAQAAAQLQKLAGELLQSKHIQQLTNTLNTVVYGRNSLAFAAADGSSGGEVTRLHLQQLQEEEQQLQQQWQQWQQQQRRLVDAGSSGSSSQQNALEEWQAGVIRSWMDDVSTRGVGGAGKGLET